MLDKYHHYQFSYHVINRVIIIASNGLKAWQLRETVGTAGGYLGALHQFAAHPQ